MAGEENPGLGRYFNAWHTRIFEDPIEFRGTQGSPEHSPLDVGVETALWATADQKAGKWYRGAVEGPERLVKWNVGEAQLSGQRRIRRGWCSWEWGEGGQQEERKETRPWE